MTTFIVGRRTPRTFRLDSASRVGPSPKAGSFRMTRLRKGEETLAHAQVLGALAATMRHIGGVDLTLKRLFDAASNDPVYGRLMKGARFAPSTSQGVPARVIIKGE